MKNSLLAPLALVVALAALILTFIQPAGEPRASEVALPASESHVDSPRFDELGDRITKLERAVDVLESTPAANPRELVKSHEEPSESEVDIAERLAKVEERMAKTAEESSLDELHQRITRGRSSDARGITEWTDQALDPASTPEELLGALRGLRGQQLEDGTDARIAVLPEMLNLVQTSQNSEQRADVWRQLSGVTDPSLLEPLLASLANDPVPKVREEAAETLEDYMPNATVEAALRFAMDNDENNRVRRQAGESLGGGRK